MKLSKLTLGLVAIATMFFTGCGDETTTSNPPVVVTNDPVLVGTWVEKIPYSEKINDSLSLLLKETLVYSTPNTVTAQDIIHASIEKTGTTFDTTLSTESGFTTALNDVLTAAEKTTVSNLLKQTTGTWSTDGKGNVTETITGKSETGKYTVTGTTLEFTFGTNKYTYTKK